MKKYLKDVRGLTLVEVLAVLVIGSIVILLIFNVHLFGQKQYKDQSTKAEQLNDVSYVAKIITKEIRKSVSVETNRAVDSKILILNNGLSDEIIFKEENDQIFMNGRLLTRGTVNFNFDGVKIEITIESKEINRKTESIKTEIYVR